jgi:hypothetical protein
LKDCGTKLVPGKKLKDPVGKIKQKRAGGVAQMVEHPPSQVRALSSTPVPRNKNKQQKKTRDALQVLSRVSQLN